MKNKLFQLKPLICVASLMLIVLTSSCSISQHKSNKQKDESLQALLACDVNAGVQQCCSASKCTGQVLSNRDAHNCKVKSRGKSWHDAAGKCTNRL